MKISIQGIKGSYHHEVATKLFGNDIELLECLSFSEIPPQIINDQSELGVMAIENSIAGAILPNYNLIDEYNLFITREFYLPIQHQLMALPGQQLADIKEVWSHPMALEQCRKFFRQFPHIKLIEEKDTAAMAKLIHDKQIKQVAAIASKEAVKIYNLEIIANDIQTHPHNYTRFVLLQTKGNEESCPYTKASVKFTLSHETGSLAKVLSLFSKNRINLTKIQSVPIIVKPWEYAFYADLIFENKNNFKQAEMEVQKLAHQWKILGLYKQQEK